MSTDILKVDQLDRARAGRDTLDRVLQHAASTILLTPDQNGRIVWTAMLLRSSSSCRDPADGVAMVEWTGQYCCVAQQLYGVTGWGTERVPAGYFRVEVRRTGPLQPDGSVGQPCTVEIRTVGQALMPVPAEDPADEVNLE